MSEVKIKIRKRQNYVVNYDRDKIQNSITKTFNAVFGTNHIDTINTVVDYIEGKLASMTNQSISVDKLLTMMRFSLIELGHTECAKAFETYREHRKQVREASKVKVDVESTIEDYVSQGDWRVKENANQGYSIGGMILNTSGKITANYWLSTIYPEAIGQAHRDGRYHIHDLSMLSPYCCGWNLKNLLDGGLNGIPGHIESKPPSNLSGAIGQMINFLGILQNEWAGAQAFSSVDTYLAPFVRKLQDSILKEYEDIAGMSIYSEQGYKKYHPLVKKRLCKEVRQCLQALIFNLNTPSRWGSQSPFSNMTFDVTCPKDLADKHPLIGGVEQSYTYGDLQSEIELINKCFIEIACGGDAMGKPFTFPIPTYNITKNFPWDSEFALGIFEMAAKYGLPYFQNFVNSDMQETDIRAMCCRLRIDKRELFKRGNGLFGSAELTGSIGVVTINMARLGIKNKGDKDGLYKELNELLGMARDSLEIKRAILAKLFNDDFYPATKRYLIAGFRNHFSTIGVNGMNEMVANFTNGKEDLTTQYGQDLCNEILAYTRDRMSDFQEKTGNLYNLEAAPAESAATRFAMRDREAFGDSIIQAGVKGANYYTNSSQLPVGFSNDLFKVLDLQDELQCKYTGGTVQHLFMGERVSSAKAAQNLVRKIFTRYKLPYITFTPTFSVCEKHGYLSGSHEYCPKCDAKIIEQYNKCACSTDRVGDDA